MRTALASHSTAQVKDEYSAKPSASERFYLQSSEEATLLKVDLSDLTLPQVNNLFVDGMQKSWWSKLLGR